MAYVGSTNVLSTRAAGAFLFNLKVALKAASWTVVSSGTGNNGTTGPGDLITTASAASVAPGDFRNANAWVRMREPGAGTREYVFKNGSADSSLSMIIKYSRATGFNTGGTATVAPTTGAAAGADGQVFFGGGTDSSPSEQPLMTLNLSATPYFQAVASDTPVNGVYGFWTWYYQANPVSNVYMVATEAVAAGSTPSNDADPSVRYSGWANNNNTGGGIEVTYANASQGVGTGAFQWWEAYGLGNATYRKNGYPGNYIAYNTTGSYPEVWPGGSFGYSSLDPYQGKVPMFPLMIGAQGVFPKGFTTASLVLKVTANVFDTYNLSSSDPKIILGPVATPGRTPFAVPWVTNVVPVV